MPDRDRDDLDSAPDRSTDPTLVWHKALELDELPDGRVKPVTCELRTVCVTRHEDQYAALDNACPHQGGPLGEGSIENGWLRCPWHGWDFHPLTGASPGSFEDGVDTFAVDVRDDGVYVGFPERPPHEETVSDVMARTLVAWGVRWVWGMVGHSNLGLADALRRREEEGELRYIGIRHEGAAAFAASAYGKLTGRPAACFSIAGPGATNLLTGLWDANVDRSPVLALTGQVDTQVLGPGAFQEVDLQAAFGKVAQWSQTVLHSSRHAELANLACKSAILNRGVSHLIFPDEVQGLPAAGTGPGGPDGRLTPRAIAPPEESLERAVELLAGSERPVIIVGHGARFEMDSVIQLAEQLDCPVITTFKAKGQISDRHPLGCGVLGRSGTPIASWFMNESNCLLVLGASFSNHTGITPKIPTIQVDYDPMMLGKFHAVTVPVWGEIGVTVARLQEGLNGRKRPASRRVEIADRWAIWREEKQSRERDDRGRGVGSAAVFAAMNRQVPDDAIIPVDVGNNTYSFGRYFECTGQAVLMSGYLGSIGFALPAALGAWAATQEEGPFEGRPVVSVSGDGGFGQYMAELTTAIKYRMNLTHVLLNNSELAKISKEQRDGHREVWQTGLHNPNFAEYARICGCLGVRVTEPEDLDAALADAIDYEGPALVEIVTDPALV
jgi:thiamine pyrophosphate-dependent acetolactate synthase large subunit-like protein/nitrite reductase/ring-hydroxylating ferredoxin subunit